MIKNVFSVFIIVGLTMSIPAFSQENEFGLLSESEEFDDSYSDIKCSAIEALKKDYGFISAKLGEKSILELSFLLPFSDVEKMLTTIVSNGWYPEFLSINSATKDKVAVYLIISEKQNDSFRRFRVLQKLSSSGVLPWKTGKIDGKEAYVTSIQTDFGSDFLVKGETIKSGLIFKNLTPRISRIGADLENLDSERFKSKKNFDRELIFTRETYEDNDTGINGQPFFERGTYKESSEVGRYMEFTLRCKW